MKKAHTSAGNVSTLTTADRTTLGNATCDVPACHDLYHRGLAVSAASFVHTSPSRLSDSVLAWLINFLGEIGVYFGFNPTAVTVLRRDTLDLNRRSVRLHLRILSRRRHHRAKPDQQSHVKRLLYYVGTLALSYVSVPLRMVLFIGWPMLCATISVLAHTAYLHHLRACLHHRDGTASLNDTPCSYSALVHSRRLHHHRWHFCRGRHCARP